MNEFIELFGNVTIAKVVVFFMAISWLGEKAWWLWKKVLVIVGTRQKEITAKEQAEKNWIKLACLQEACGALLQLSLFTETQRILNQGYISTADLELINTMYKPYHEMGLNGTGTKLYNECIALPTACQIREGE